MRAKLMTWLNVLLALAILAAIPAGLFHAASGRYAQATVALGCALVGACLLVMQWRTPLQAPSRGLRSEVGPGPHPAQTWPTWIEPPREPGPLPGWLSRAVMSGFIATAAITILFFIAYGASAAAGSFQPAWEPASTFALWLRALTRNQVLDLAASGIYLAAIFNIVVGVLWALVYGYYAEPRLSGSHWRRGATFALFPWALSLVVFLPAMGGGLLGLSLGAGPLPAIGNLILHLGYGVTLGAVYGPLGDISADEFSRAAPRDDRETVTHYERATARGIVVGGGIGTLLGVALFAIMAPHPSSIPSLGFIPGGMALGAILGELWASVAGLAPSRDHHPVH